MYFLVRTLERARSTGNFSGEGANELAIENIKSDMSSHDSSDENDENERSSKRMKTNAY